MSTSHVAFSAVRVMRTLGMLGEVAGMAAAICKQHDCLPRGVYTDHLDELKAMMNTGVNIPAAFACGGIGKAESYHFKDIGWWHLHTGTCSDNSHKPRIPDEAEVKKFSYCVNALGITHQFPVPEEWER